MQDEEHIEGVLTFEEVTHGVRIAVQSYYLDEQSEPENGKFFWAYRIKIINESDEKVKLIDRHWVIIDGNGITKEVKGEGVIGEQPLMQPSQEFIYTSGTPLDTPSGFMRGTYGMIKGEKERIDVVIPAFSLDSPYGELKIN